MMSVPLTQWAEDSLGVPDGQGIQINSKHLDGGEQYGTLDRCHSSRHGIQINCKHLDGGGRYGTLDRYHPPRHPTAGMNPEQCGGELCPLTAWCARSNSDNANHETGAHTSCNPQRLGVRMRHRGGGATGETEAIARDVADTQDGTRARTDLQHRSPSQVTAPKGYLATCCSMRCTGCMIRLPMQIRGWWPLKTGGDGWCL